MSASRMVALIPARYGSTRFPGKPLAEVFGKPLIQWVYEQACRVSGLGGVYVATDDPRIEECVRGFGGQALLTRGDHASGTDRVAEAAGLLGLAGHDIVLNVQGDQPVFPPLLAGHLAQVAARDCSAVMVTPARREYDLRAASDPNVVKVVLNHRGRALYFSRSPIPYWREGQKPFFYRHIGLYAYRVDFLREFVSLPPGRLEEAEKLEQLRALEYGYPIVVVETAEETLEVDTPADLERFRQYLARRQPSPGTPIRPGSPQDLSS